MRLDFDLCEFQENPVVDIYRTSVVVDDVGVEGGEDSLDDLRRRSEFVEVSLHCDRVEVCDAKKRFARGGDIAGEGKNAERGEDAIDARVVDDVGDELKRSVRDRTVGLEEIRGDGNIRCGRLDDESVALVNHGSVGVVESAGEVSEEELPIGHDDAGERSWE